MYFSYFSQKIGFVVCLKLQGLFSGKNENINLSSAEFAQRLKLMQLEIFTAPDKRGYQVNILLLLHENVCCLSKASLMSTHNICFHGKISILSD